MKALHRSFMLLGLMSAAAVAGWVGQLDTAPRTDEPAYVLEAVLPRAFGGWRELPDETAQVVNPQTRELLDKLYSQILARTYVDADGYRIMLSLAYGDDQRGGLQAHMPEVCYPAQGFELHGRALAELATPHGVLPVTRLQTSLGARREPVTYWFTLGDQVVQGGSRFEKRLTELRFALTGQVPAGLLFRVSSLDGQPEQAYARHDRFIRALLGAVQPADRLRLSGLAN